jgi:serine/threonine protein kinase
MGHVDPVGGSNPQSQETPRVIPFGKYLLLDRIAVGGMAEVYTAKSFGIEGFEKIIAIKRILPTMAEDQDFISMFIDEAKIAGHLTHANVVPIYELGKIGESHYIAMEYVWGKDLLQIMNRFRRMRRHMPPVMAAWIASKILEGLDYAHRKRDRHGRPMGIIHRDVSPQNVLVSYEGQVKLIDFGIAKAASRNTKTQAGVLKGKFGYMSPEQVRGLPIDHRSDIFAASTCLHEMLTGERLFVGESDFSTLEKVRNADVLPPSQRVHEIPKELEEIVLKGLAREPDERWQTAGEMQEELQRFIALQRPPFGTSKLNTWMRTAFANEISKEKARIDRFSKVSHPGVGAPAPQPRPPAPAPAAPPPPPPGPSAPAMDDLSAFGDEDDDLGGEATMITASPFDAMEEAGGGAPEEIAEEATQIFFSAEDMEEIVEEDSPPATAPAGSLSSPAPPAGQMPPPRAVGTPGPPPSSSVQASSVQASSVQASSPTPAPAPASGGVRSTMQMPPGAVPQPPPSQQPSPDMFAPPPPGGAPSPGGGRQRHLPTMEVERPGQMQPASQKKGGMGKWIAILAAATFVLVGGLVVGGIFLFGGEDTGTVSVRVSPEAADARIFVDGRQRGRAPLLLEHVPEGEHTIEVRADGYQPTQEALQVTAGSTSMIQLALEPEAPEVATAPAEPAEAGGGGGATAEAAAPSADEGEAEETAAAQAEDTEAEEAEEAEEATAEAEEPVAQEPERQARAERTQRTQRTRERSRPTPVRRERAERPARRAGGSHGTLTINSIPWARVFIDGRDTGRNTPVRNLRVPAGSHTIGLRTNDGVMHNVPVTVEAGQNQRIVRQF